jgi:hypothetical protein
LTYLKAVGVGVGIGLLAAVLWLGALFLPPYGERLICDLQNCGGGIGAPSVGSWSTLLVALVGFAIGFYWTIQQAWRRRSAIST